MSPSRKTLAIAAAVVAAIAVVVLAVVNRDEGAPVVTAPTVTPTSTPTPDVAQPEPFRVELARVVGRSLDSGNIYRRKPPQRPRLTRRWARRAADDLERYLNRAFVQPETRFTARALNGFLTPQARQSLTGQARSALGVGAPEIEGGTTEVARARATVLFQGRKPVSVTLLYTARMTTVWSDGPDQPLRQRGTVVMVPQRGGWRAQMLQVGLTRPQPPRPTESPTGDDA